MKAIILAATHQKGKDLNGKEVPLPLVDLGKQSLLTRLVDNVSSIPDINEIFIVTNNTIKPALDAWAELLSERYPVHVISDGTDTYDTRRGALGDIQYVIGTRNISEDILVVGGNNWFAFNLSEFAKMAKTKSPSVLVTAITTKGINVSRFGLVQVNQESRIVNFIEKPESSDFQLKACCVYYFSENDLKMFDEFPKEQSLVYTPGDYMAWLIKKVPCYAITMTGTFFPVGTKIGPDMLAIRNIMRKMIHPKCSTWESDTLKELYHVSSYTDLLDILKNKDINRKIVAIRILGQLGQVDQHLNEKGKKEVIDHLRYCLSDRSPNSYVYAGFECDENEPAVVVSKEAVKSLILLNYATSEKEVIDKARNEGVDIRD